MGSSRAQGVARRLKSLGTSPDVLMSVQNSGKGHCRRLAGGGDLAASQPIEHVEDGGRRRDNGNTTTCGPTTHSPHQGTPGVGAGTARVCLLIEVCEQSKENEGRDGRFSLRRADRMCRLPAAGGERGEGVKHGLVVAQQAGQGFCIHRAAKQLWSPGAAVRIRRRGRGTIPKSRLQLQCI